MQVSILILTYNEENNIRRCLSSVEWCEDIVVVDSGSTDHTVDIAKEQGATVLSRPFDNFANQRNFGLDQHDFKNNWVLHLDADEVATPEFSAALSALIDDSEIDAYRIPSKTMFFGKWIKHAGMWPTYQVRLGRRGKLRFVQVGHGQREDMPVERIGDFNTPYEHYSFSHGLERWLLKHVAYAREEAELLIQFRHSKFTHNGDLSDGGRTERRRLAKQRSARLPFFVRPAARFTYVYFLRGGFRDGFRGLVYALMLSVYEGMTAILAYESIWSTQRQASQSQKVPD